MEVTENGVILSANQFPGETKTYSYKARVVSEGEFIAPPASAFVNVYPGGIWKIRCGQTYRFQGTKG